MYLKSTKIGFKCHTVVHGKFYLKCMHESGFKFNLHKQQNEDQAT